MFSVILSFILVIIGALNWLCIGFFQYDLVAGIFGSQASIFSRIIYIIVGLSAVWLTYAVIRYKATLQLMSKRIDRDMNISMNNFKRATNSTIEAGKDFFTGDYDKSHNEKSDTKSQKYESGRYNDVSNYTSYGYDYNNSRKSKRDYEEDENED